MLRDVNTGIRWILNHVHQHGGNPDRVFLVGQSCGAQLSALALITQAGVPFPLPALVLYGMARLQSYVKSISACLQMLEAVAQTVGRCCMHAASAATETSQIW